MNEIKDQEPFRVSFRDMTVFTPGLGDCFRACVATIFDFPIEDMPNFWEQTQDPHEFWMLVDVWVRGHLHHTCLTFSLSPEHTYMLADVVCIATGNTKRTTEEHCVVWKNGIVHDPHPSRKGIRKPEVFTIFIPVKGAPHPMRELEEENQRLMDEIRDLEWKIYRPLKEGEMTQEGDQVLGPEEDAKWEPVAGNYRPAPSPLYPAHCQYRRPIVDELRKNMEEDFFYRKCVAGKESARSKRIKKLEAEVAKLTTALKDKPDQSDLDAAVFRINHLEAENERLREERDRYLEELVVAKNVIKSDESQIKNLIKRNDEMRDDCIRTAEQRDKLADENAKLRELLHKGLMGGVFFASDLVDEIKQALKEASHEG